MEAFRLYKDGREEPIRGVQFVGVDKRVLRDIIFAGPQSNWTNLTDDTPNANRYSIGVAGGMGTSWSAPAVLISEIELKGQGGKENRIIPNPKE